MSQFEKLGLLATLTRPLEQGGFTQPTPIQEKAIPIAVEGRDVLGLAQTGTGKTLAFSLPMVQYLMTEGRDAGHIGLVMAPTRELVNQIVENVMPFAKSAQLRIVKVVGGQSINRQIAALSRGADIIVATPGRLIDLMDRGSVDLGRVHFLALDEADQMLDLGFIHALRKIAPNLGTPRQTMMFSATMPKQLGELSRAYLDNPARVEVAPSGKTADKIEQSVEFVEKADKPARLRELLRGAIDEMVLVFSRTKHGAEKMKRQLEREGFKAESVHGNKSQNQRDRAIKAFCDGTANILVATDVAARGIDIEGVALVINYDLPQVPEIYVHRIGRTARAGREGVAVTLCSADEIDQLRDIEKLIGRDFGGGAGKYAGAVKRRAGGRASANRNPRNGGGGQGRNPRNGGGGGQNKPRRPNRGKQAKPSA